MAGRPAWSCRPTPDWAAERLCPVQTAPFALNKGLLTAAAAPNGQAMNSACVGDAAKPFRIGCATSWWR